MNEIEHTQDLATRFALEYGPRIASAVVILVAGYFVMQWVGRLAARSLRRFALEPPTRNVLAANPRVLREPAPLVQTAALGEWSVTLSVRPWVAVPDYETAIGELNTELARAFGERGVQLQTPATILHPSEGLAAPSSDRPSRT